MVYGGSDVVLGTYVLLSFGVNVPSYLGKWLEINDLLCFYHPIANLPPHVIRFTSGHILSICDCKFE